MAETILIIALGVAAGITVGKALDIAPIPSWAQWGLLAAAVIISMYFLMQQ